MVRKLNKRQPFRQFLKELAADIYSVSVTLFKIMIPVLIIVKILDELGFTQLLGAALSPVMALVGLPENTGLIWAATLLTNLYTGLVVFAGTTFDQPLTIAQVTTLSAMLLLAHALPLEGSIARKAGISFIFTVVFRIICGFGFAWLSHQYYDTTSSGQNTAVIVWQASGGETQTLSDWAITQVKALAGIQLLIIILITLLKILKIIGVENLIALLLSPALKLMGISRKAISLTIVGVTLGLSFGGGLLIKEAQEGHIPPKDIFAAITLLGILHSIIEDTLLVLLIGADLHMVLWGRLLFVFVVVGLLVRIVGLARVEWTPKLYRSVAQG